MTTFSYIDENSIEWSGEARERAALNDLVASLERPEHHDFDAADTVAGVVVEVRNEQNLRGETVPVVVVRTAEGIEDVIECSPTALRRRVERNPPAPGDLFAVRYKGMKKTAELGRDYRDFEVRQAPGMAPEHTPPHQDEPPISEPPIPDPRDDDMSRPDDADPDPF